MKFLQFVLWKQNERGKWIKYNGTFENTPASYSYMRGVRLIRNCGWLPYYVGAKPGKHEPIDIGQDGADITRLEELIKNSDPVGYEAGEAFRQYSHTLAVRDYEKQKLHQEAQYARDYGTIIYTDEYLEEINDRALQIAIQDYKAGKTIPSFLAKKVIDICTRKQ